MIAHDQALADLIVQNAFRRRRLLAQARAGMRIVGSRPSADARRIRQFAARNRLAHVFLDVETAGGRRHPRPPRRQRRRRPDRGHAGRRGAAQPVQCGARKGRRVRERPDAGHRLRRRRRGRRAGRVAASVYTASEGLATATIDGSGVGGQIGTTSRIENYLGFPVGVSGDEFAERAVVQVLRFGVTLLVPAAAVGLSPQGHGYAVELDGGNMVLARSVIVATGVKYRQLDATGLERFDGLGVFYTPIAAQDELGPGDEAVIVGGGNSAGQAATFLADRGHAVTVVVRGGDLRASMSEYLIERIAEQPAIEVLCHCAVEAVEGRGRLERVVVRDAIGVGAPSRQRRCSSSSVPSRTPRGRGAPSSSTATGSSSPVRSEAPPRSDDRHGTALSAARTCWRPTCPGCSPRVTCAAARSSVLHQQSVKGPSPPIS